MLTLSSKRSGKFNATSPREFTRVTKNKHQNITWAIAVVLRSFLWFVPTLLSLINFPPAAAVWRRSCHLPYISQWQAPNVVYRADVRSQLIANEAVAGKCLAEWASVCATIRLAHCHPPRTQKGTRSDKWWNKDVNPGVATEKLIRKEQAVSINLIKNQPELFHWEVRPQNTNPFSLTPQHNTVCRFPSPLL